MVIGFKQSALLLFEFLLGTARCLFMTPARICSDCIYRCKYGKRDDIDRQREEAQRLRAEYRPYVESGKLLL